MLGKPIPEHLLINMPQGDPMQHLPVSKKIVGVSSTKFVGGLKLSTNLDEDDSFSMDAQAEVFVWLFYLKYSLFNLPLFQDSFPPIGEEFLEIVPSSGKKTAFRCKLCDCNCGDPASKEQHIRGRRHRLAYKQKIDSSIQVEEKFIQRGPMDLMAMKYEQYEQQYGQRVQK
jgi:zinc finger RNA-binding protein